jgi:hypothetical protein
MMSKLIYYPLALTFLVGVVFLILAFKAPGEKIYIRAIDGPKIQSKELIADTLAQKTQSDLFVEPAPNREVFWRIATPSSDTIYLIEYTQPFVFNEAGTYHIEAFNKLRKVGTSTVHVPEGQFVKFDISSNSLILGEELTAQDLSTVSAEKKRWRVTETGNDETLKELEDSTEFNWTAEITGDYTLYLEYLDAEGGVNFSESERIEVSPKQAPVAKSAPAPIPKRDPSAAEILADKEKQEEKNRRKQEQQQADARDTEKARKEKERKNRASMPSWYDHTTGAQFTAGPATPEDRRQVTFKSGMAVFTLIAKEDFALTSLHYWGNYNTGNVTINMQCLTCSDQKTLRAIKFLSGQGTDFAAERTVASGKGFVKGQTYKVTITMEKETELGFVKLGKMEWNDPYMELKFETQETPVYGLTFQKR